MRKSHIELAHDTWGKILQPGDHAIDATCGNGKDTLALAQILFSRSPTSSLLGIDIQKCALERTHAYLSAHLPAAALERLFLFQQSHVSFPPLAHQLPIRLIVYNLGYLPLGDKSLTTLTESTLESLRAAQSLLLPGGTISLLFYPGHPEGLREYAILSQHIEGLTPHLWATKWHRSPSSDRAPVLLFLEKLCK